MSDKDSNASDSEKNINNHNALEDNSKSQVEANSDFGSEDKLTKEHTSAIQDLMSAAGLPYFKSKLNKNNKKIDMSDGLENATSIYMDHDPLSPDPIDEDSQDVIDVFEGETVPHPKKNKIHKVLIASSILVLCITAAYKFIPLILEPIPPGEDVVASYNNKNITTDELLQFMTLEGIEVQENITLEIYKKIVEVYAVEKIIQDWAKENKITQREDVEHGLKDLIKDVSIENLIVQMQENELSPKSISKWEVQAYFDENKKLYEDKALGEVEAEIRNILVNKKSEIFLPEYIEKLKQNAGLNVNLDILKVEPPSDDEIKSYYAKNLSMYVNEDKNQKSFEQVKNEVKATVIREKTDAQYQLRKDEALFTIHGKRYTLGEFLVELNELPQEYQKSLAGYEGKKSLVEQLIIKELLVEEYGDESQSNEDQHQIEDLKKQYLRQILHKEEVDEKISDITDEEAEQFYNENKDRLMNPVQAKISLLRIDQGLNGEKAEQAKTRADEALSSLQNGVDFAEVAKQYSDDDTAKIGGEIDEWIHEADLDPELGEAIFKLQQGETSQAFEVHGSLYIVKMRERQDPQQQSFEEVKEVIKSHLFDKKHIDMEAKLEKELLDKAQLVIYDKTLRKLVKSKNNN